MLTEKKRCMSRHVGAEVTGLQSTNFFDKIIHMCLPSSTFVLSLVLKIFEE